MTGTKKATKPSGNRPSAQELIESKRSRITDKFLFSPELEAELKIMLDAIDSGTLSRNERPSCEDALAFARAWGWNGGKDTFIRMIKRTFDRRSWLEPNK